MEIIDEEFHGEEVAVLGGDDEGRSSTTEDGVCGVGIGALFDEHPGEVDAIRVTGPAPNVVHRS